MQGIELLEGDVWGHRKDLDEYFTVDDETLEAYGSLDSSRFNIFSNRFFGTQDMMAADPDGYVEISVVPQKGSRLPPDREACCFSFELSSVDRVTNGYGVPGSRTLWRELVGISYSVGVNG